MNVTRREHFGLIGLKIKDIITFMPTGKQLMVASGRGTPENGGTTVVEFDGDDLSKLKLHPLPPKPYYEVTIGEKKELPKSRKGTLKVDLFFIKGKDLMSLRIATRLLMGAEFTEKTDIWSYWTYEGTVLREMLNNQ